MLKLERVSKFYSAHGLVSTGFSKVDLEFHVGEFVAITGESGSGKSTLLNVISGLDSYEEGEMFVMGEPTSGYSKEDLEEYRKKYIGNIFQTFNLINSYTVYQNIELVLLLSGYEKKQIARIKEIIEKVGLTGLEKKKASKLSGGQKQRVAIARALAKETPIIVADEPTGNLDVKSAAEIIALLHELSKDKLIIIVTHNYEQVEPYVTRKITMHDGRVAEDKELRPALPADEDQIKTAKADALRLGSQVRLGVRNTFNLPAKFFLLCIVFLFLCSGAISMYATVQNMGDSMDSGWNNYFVNSGKDRILVTKEDRSVFTEKDYKKLASIDNVERIVKNDLSLDLQTSITEENQENSRFWISAQLADASLYKDQLKEGRMPKNRKEAIFMVPRDGYAINHMEDALKNQVVVTDDYTGNNVFKDSIKVVGYGYLTEEQVKEMDHRGFYTGRLSCVNEKAMDQVRMVSLEKYCRQEYEFAEQIFEGSSFSGMYPIQQSEYVAEGEVYIPEDIAMMSMYSAYGQELKLTNKSLYFEDDFTFTVGAVINKDNCNYYLGIEDFYSVNTTAIYISPKDYKRIFDKENFQSSVMTADTKLTAQTAAHIEEAGYKPFVVSDGLISYDEEMIPVFNIMRTLLLVGVLVVLFFVSYFIIKLILKSRNVYFSTIRMLGATKENAGNLLKIELFIVFNLAFAACSAFVYAVKAKVIPVDELISMASYLETKDLAILYIMLCILTILLAVRYAKQLFKQTAMNAYKEEV